MGDLNESGCEDEPPPEKPADVVRLARILEDGWTIFAPDGSDDAYIIIDNREDEPIPHGVLFRLVPEPLTCRHTGDFRGRSGLLYDLRRGPEAEVTLRFKSKAEKDYFLGQLSDGWGENIVQLDWDWRHGENLPEVRAAGVINTGGYRPERKEIY